MKRLEQIIRAAIGIAVVAAIVAPWVPEGVVIERAIAQPPPAASGHLIWDPVDQKWFCEGTPVNCDF